MAEYKIVVREGVEPAHYVKWPYKIVKVIGQYPPLEVVERRIATMGERPGRDGRPARPAYTDGQITLMRQRAGQDRTQDMFRDETTGEPQKFHRDEAIRLSVLLEQHDTAMELVNRLEEEIKSIRFPEQEGDDETESDYVTDDGINQIKILRGTFGCPSGDHADIDPYYNRVNWHEAARGDGMSYSGTLETVERKEGETLEDLLKRAGSKAAELDTELHCSRCYPIEED